MEKHTSCKIGEGWVSSCLYNSVVFIYKKLSLMRREEYDSAISFLKVVCNLLIGEILKNEEGRCYAESGIAPECYLNMNPR